MKYEIHEAGVTLASKNVESSPLHIEKFDLPTRSALEFQETLLDTTRLFREVHGGSRNDYTTISETIIDDKGAERSLKFLPDGDDRRISYLKIDDANTYELRIDTHYLAFMNAGDRKATTDVLSIYPMGKDGILAERLPMNEPEYKETIELLHAFLSETVPKIKEAQRRKEAPQAKRFSVLQTAGRIAIS